MRMLSCARIKKPGLYGERQLAPRAGTKARTLYDAYMLRPATPINPKEIAGNNGVRAQTALIDFYGLDIRSYGRGTYWLVGHYGADGTYTDFIAHRVTDPMVAA